MGISILQGGMLTTVQDIGRLGMQQFGVPIAGAVDARSLKIANLLAGNPEDEAALEITLMGPHVRFECANVIAITGADLSPTINGQPVSMYRAVRVKLGDELSFGAIKSGFRAYVAFAGGFDLPAVMGSKSTYVRAGIGGYEGRKLQTGDHIAFSAPKETLHNMETRIVQPEDFSSPEFALRVVRGPQIYDYTPEAYNTLFSTTFTVANESDRMGMRLSGASIGHVGDGNMISDGIAPGSIQIPPNGQPIIALADGHTTGGYTKIATVISTDLPLLGQSKPGNKIRFLEVGVEQAQEIYISRLEQLNKYKAQFESPPRHASTTYHYLISVDGEKYEAFVEKME